MRCFRCDQAYAATTNGLCESCASLSVTTITHGVHGFYRVPQSLDRAIADALNREREEKAQQVSTHPEVQ